METLIIILFIIAILNDLNVRFSMTASSYRESKNKDYTIILLTIIIILNFFK